MLIGTATLICVDISLLSFRCVAQDDVVMAGYNVNVSQINISRHIPYPLAQTLTQAQVLAPTACMILW